MVTSPSSVLGATRSFPTWWAVLLIIVGFLALALPFEAGVAIAIAVAILVIIAGVVHLAGTLAARGIPPRHCALDRCDPHGIATRFMPT